MLKEYFTEVLLVTTFIALATAVPHPRLKQTTKFGAGILLICVFLLPLVDIIKDIDLKMEIDDYIGSINDEESVDVIKAAFEEGICEHLATEYGVDESLIGVYADGFDISTLRAERIYVTLSGRAAVLDYKRIESELERDFTNNGECEVSVKIG